MVRQSREKRAGLPLGVDEAVAGEPYVLLWREGDGDMISWVEMAHNLRAKVAAGKGGQKDVGGEPMDKDTTTTPSEPEAEAAAPADESTEALTPSVDAWREVGRQFKDLGETMAVVFRTAWQSEENRRHLKAMQGGLETMANEVSEVVKHTASLPETLQVREGASKAVATARGAGEKAFDEARPHLLTALRQLDGELRRMIERMEAEQRSGEAAPAPAEAADEEPS